MQFTEEETKKLKTMFLFVIKRKLKESDGNSGFQITELIPILEALEQDGAIKLRPTINSKMYFLNLKKQQ